MKPYGLRVKIFIPTTKRKPPQKPECKWHSFGRPVTRERVSLSFPRLPTAVQQIPQETPSETPHQTPSPSRTWRRAVVPKDNGEKLILQSGTFYRTPVWKYPVFCMNKLFSTLSAHSNTPQARAPPPFHNCQMCERHGWVTLTKNVGGKAAQ